MTLYSLVLWEPEKAEPEKIQPVSHTLFLQLKGKCALSLLNVFVVEEQFSCLLSHCSGGSWEQNQKPGKGCDL